MSGTVVDTQFYGGVSHCIVDVASIAALAPTPGMWFYNASKGALAAAALGKRMTTMSACGLSPEKLATR